MRVSIVVLSALAVAMSGALVSAQANWKNGLLGMPNETIGARPAKKPIAKRRKVVRARTTGKATRSAKPRRKLSARRGYQRGIASYYWQPQRVASGGWFNPNALTAAHRTLRFGTRVRVTNLRNGRSVVVRINDRGPFIKGRIIDLSRRAAGIVGMRKSGIAPVRLDIL